MDYQEKIRKWIFFIQNNDLEIAASESKEMIWWQIDPKLNKMIFKILLHLSHVADRPASMNVVTAERIYTIARCVCSSLIEIPDAYKMISSIYFIVKRLIVLRLCDEAIQVCEYVQRDKIVMDTTPEQKGMCVKLARLWQEAIDGMLESLKKEFTMTAYTAMLDTFSFELKILEFEDKRYDKIIVERILQCLEKVDDLDVDARLKLECSRKLSDFLARVQLDPSWPNRYSIYQRVLVYICSRVKRQLSATSIENASKVLENTCAMFDANFRNDSELSECLFAFKMTVLGLLNPFPELEKDPSGKKLHFEALEIIKRRWNNKLLMDDLVKIGSIVQDLMPYWDTCMKNEDERFFNTNNLQEYLRISQLVSEGFAARKASPCQTCKSKKCEVEADVYSAGVVGIKVATVFSKIPSEKLAKELFPLLHEILESCVSWILELKEKECGQWTILWGVCCTTIYNVGVGYHKKSYEEGASMFSLLTGSVAIFEGIDTVESISNIKYPLATALYRLSNVHYIHGNYREAMTPCALGGLLDSRLKNPESKLFKFWAGIKRMSSEVPEVFDTTMLDCLKRDMEIISRIGIDVDLASYDLPELTLREMKGLLEVYDDLSSPMRTLLDQLVSLKTDPIRYIAGVRLAGNHLLHSKFDEEFLKHLRRAIDKARKLPTKGVDRLCANADLDLYSFVAQLQEISEKTRAEMETTKLTLRASRSERNEILSHNSDSVVPAYTMINVREDNKLFDHLERAIDKWNVCVTRMLNEVVTGWQPRFVLENMVIAAEYCRLHRFSRLEIIAWGLVYALALKLGEKRICVKAVGRTIFVGRATSEQLATAEQFSEELKKSTDPDTIDTVVTYWLSLSDYYFKIGLREDAMKFVTLVEKLPKMTSSKNISTYIATTDSLLRNVDSGSDSARGKQYMLNIVRCLYSIVALIDCLEHPAWGCKERQLSGYDVLLTCTSNLALRMNSIFSYREISSHLRHRLKMAQTLGATLRVAECLKYLCYLDLSRAQSDECEAKLQGLEYILRIEYAGEPKTKQSEPACLTPIDHRSMEPVRDAPSNGGSPVLRKYKFQEPDFLSHGECNCYKCSSTLYQDLVFACVHIRAQLYALEGCVHQALQYYEGAFVMRQKLLAASLKSGRRDATGEMKSRGPVWTSYCNVVDYVLFLLDFSRFVREFRASDEHEELKIAGEALEICTAFGLQNHPIYVSTRELILGYQFSTVIKDSDLKKFTVPQPGDVDVSRYASKPTNSVAPPPCTTPPSIPVVKSRPARRLKTPPLLKLTKVPIDLNDDDDDDDDDEAVNVSAKSSSRPASNGARQRTKLKSARKNLDKYLTAASTTSDEDSDAASKTGGRIKSRPSGLKSLIDEASYAVPHIKRRLAKIEDDDELTEIEKIDKAIRLVEGLGVLDEKVTTGRTNRSSRTRAANGLASRKAMDEKIDRIIQAFRKIIVNDDNAALYSRHRDSEDETIGSSTSTGQISVPTIEATSDEKTGSSEAESAETSESKGKCQTKTNSRLPRRKTKLDTARAESSERESETEATKLVPRRSTRRPPVGKDKFASARATDSESDVSVEASQGASKKLSFLGDKKITTKTTKFQSYSRSTVMIYNETSVTASKIDRPKRGGVERSAARDPASKTSSANNSNDRDRTIRSSSTKPVAATTETTFLLPEYNNFENELEGKTSSKSGIPKRKRYVRLPS